MINKINLPYSLDALEPYYSKEALAIHYETLYTGYVDNTNKTEEKKEYTYYVAKHESNGNTYYTKYFNKNRGYSLGNLDLSDGEALVDLKEFLDNLERIESIEDIIDISLIKKVILDSFGEKSKVFLKP